MYVFAKDKLASYPGVKVPTPATLDLVAQLVEGKINGVIGDADVDSQLLHPIAFEVAARSLRNPTGASSITSGIDDWKQTLRYEGEAAMAMRAGIYLTPDEQREIRQLAGLVPVASRRRPRSITLRPGW